MLAGSVNLKKRFIVSAQNASSCCGKSIKITSILLVTQNAKYFIFKLLNLKTRQPTLNNIVFQSWVCSFGAQFFCLKYKNNFLKLLGRNTTVLMICVRWADQSQLVTSLFLPVGKGLKNSRTDAFFLVLHQQFHSKCLLRGIHHIQESIFILLTFIYFRNWCGYAHHAVPIH